MTEISPFTITEMTREDVEEATAMRLESWLDTYVNKEAGVTREWIEARNADQMSPEKKESRVKRFIKGKQEGTFNAWVAKDEQGTIIGSTTPFIDEQGNQRLGSLYVDKHWHGKGVAGQLIQKVIDWFDSTKPIELMVVTYNDRARAFYRKRGFVEVPDSNYLFDDKIPEVKMIRKAQDEIQS